MIWPTKTERESLEIEGFLESYRLLPHGRDFEVSVKGESPDYDVIDRKTGEHFGIELTSVYLSDTSVPTSHMPDQDDPIPIEDNPEELQRYKLRLVQAVSEKVRKAANYTQAFPLILSVYVNEYISIYLSAEELDSMVKQHESVFDVMQPFSEIVFWNLPNGLVYSVCPS